MDPSVHRPDDENNADQLSERPSPREIFSSWANDWNILLTCDVQAIRSQIPEFASQVDIFSTHIDEFDDTPPNVTGGHGFVKATRATNVVHKYLGNSQNPRLWPSWLKPSLDKHVLYARRWNRDESKYAELIRQLDFEIGLCDLTEDTKDPHHRIYMSEIKQMLELTKEYIEGYWQNLHTLIVPVNPPGEKLLRPAEPSAPVTPDSHLLIPASAPDQEKAD